MYQPGYPASGYPPQQGYPPQGYPQQGYPAQSGYPAPSGAMPQQYFVLVSRLHGLVLDIERGTATPGARVMPWKRHGKDNQLWHDDPATGTIRTKLNGFCLDIEGDQSLRVMPYQPGDPNQQWEHDAQGYIRNRVNRNKVLDIFNQAKEPGAKIGMWDANGGPNQLWNIEHVGGYQPGMQGSQPYPASQPYPGMQPQYPGSEQYPGSQPYGQGTPGQYGGQYPGAYPATGATQPRREFFIVSDLNGLVLDVKGANASPGAEVIMWNKKQTPSKNQLWYVDQTGVIRSALNDYTIDAPNGQKTKLQPFNGGPSQQWTLDGKKITNRGSGDCLDICGENRMPGAEVCSWRFKDSHNQHWHADYIN